MAAPIRKLIRPLASFPHHAWLVAMLLLAGCATTGERAARGPVFYPPLPNPPRIQYLRTFSEARDAGDKPSAFAEFIAGKEAGESETIKKPYGAAIHEGRIYVADSFGPGVGVFDLVAKRFRMLETSGAGALQQPINITVDRDGTKYVTDTRRNQILAYDRFDKFIRAYGVIDQFRPSDVAIAGDRLYVADVKNHQIQVLDKRTGQMIRKFGQRGSRDGEFLHPTNLTVSSDNFLYVTDTSNYRVQKLTLDGQFVRSYGGVGTALGRFARPKGIAVDREGRIYVVDAAFDNVQIFDNDGQLLLFFGGRGDGPEAMDLPASIAIDYDNIALFQPYADPAFKLEYVILVANNYGPSKVNVYGFGRMEGHDYTTGVPSTPATR